MSNSQAHLDSQGHPYTIDSTDLPNWFSKDTITHQQSAREWRDAVNETQTQLESIGQQTKLVDTDGQDLQDVNKERQAQLEHLNLKLKEQKEKEMDFNEKFHNSLWEDTLGPNRKYPNPEPHGEGFQSSFGVTVNQSDYLRRDIEDRDAEAALWHARLAEMGCKLQLEMERRMEPTHWGEQLIGKWLKADADDAKSKAKLDKTIRKWAEADADHAKSNAEFDQMRKEWMSIGIDTPSQGQPAVNDSIIDTNQDETSHSKNTNSKCTSGEQPPADTNE